MQQIHMAGCAFSIFAPELAQVPLLYLVALASIISAAQDFGHCDTKCQQKVSKKRHIVGSSNT